MVNINSLERDGLRQAELCPRHTMVMNTKEHSAAKIGGGVMVLVLCTTPDGALYLYQVS